MTTTTVNRLFNELMNINVIGPLRRPTTRCKFKRSTVNALYDTGSCVTCMNEETFKKLSPDERAFSQPARSFLSASGDRMKTKGAINLKMEIEGKAVAQTVHVIPQLHEPFILGIDFIRSHQFSYCPKHNSFYWEERCPLENDMILVLKERMIIPPLCRRICTVKVEGGPLPEVGIATVQISEMPWIRGGPVVTKGNSNNQIVLEIRNASPVPRELPRNCRVGVFEGIQEADLIPVENLQGVPEDEEIRQEVDVGAVSAQRRDYDDKRRRLFPTQRKPTPGAGQTREIHEVKKFIDEKVTLNCSDKEKRSYLDLFYQHGKVFSKNKNDLGRCDLVQHEIHLKDKNPVYIKQFKIPEVHATAIEEQVKEWLKLDIVQPSMSRYNSPIFVVKKKDGAFRLVQDFRALNAQTYPDRYSMRDVTDCIHEIGKSGSTIFSTIDLTSGFWQMVLKPECREYTAFTVYGMGQYEFKTSPMGLLGCPASFQRLMEAVMKGLPNVLVYIDDILVHSRSHEEHRKTLDAVFRRLAQHNLKIRLEKCCFATQEVEYLGFRLTPEGVIPGTDKTAVIRSAAPPDNVQRVRQFLGLCNFFRNHIRDFAIRSHPLTVLTRKDCEWKGGPLPPDALKSFNELKTALTSTPLVAFPRKDRQYALITDAATGDDNNPGGMGAILTQIDKDGKFYVISYASRKLVKHEVNYTPFLLEMHAAVWGMEHFSHHLKGQRFLLFTDHKPLEKLGKVHTKTLYRIQEAMMEYDFEIFYKKGEEMPADFLSRNINALSPELSLENICRLQNADAQLSVIINYFKSGKLPQSAGDRRLIVKYSSRCFLDNDVLWIRFYRPEIGSRSVICLPESLHATAIEHMHSSWYGGHCGTMKTTERLLLYFYWPNIHNDVKAYLANCERCQKRQTNPKIPTAQLQPLPLLSDPNQRVHADLFGPLRTSDRGKKFILVMTDAFTRYVELVAIENKETETVAQAIFVHWICRYGVPLEIVTDQGKEFVSHVCQELWKKLDLVHNTTTPRHPQANAQAEVVNRTIIRYLSSFVDDSTLDWETFLAPLMFSYNTTFHRSLKTSPFFMTFGVHPRLPCDITQPQYGSDLPTELMQRLQVARNIARTFMNKAALEYKTQHDLKAKQRQFFVHQQVLLDEHSFLHKNQKLCPKFSGPHLITKLKGAVNVELLLDNGRRVVVHVNRIKPFLSHGQGVPSQNRGGVTETSSDVEQDDETPTGLVEQDETTPTGLARQPSQRLTRSATKQQGLVFDKNTLQFSHPETVQAIGSKERKQTKPKPKTKTEQVISHYISRYIDSDEEDWDVTPEWDQQVEKESIKQESSDDEFLDVSEGDSLLYTDREILADPHTPPPEIETQAEDEFKAEELEKSPKGVRFYPYVLQRKYKPDTELQKLEDEKDELIRAAKAAVQKVNEQIEDARRKGSPQQDTRPALPRGLSRDSSDIIEQQRRRDPNATTVGQQRRRSTSVPSRATTGAQRTTHGGGVPQVSDTTSVGSQPGTIPSAHPGGSRFRETGTLSPSRVVNIEHRDGSGGRIEPARSTHSSGSNVDPGDQWSFPTDSSGDELGNNASHLGSPLQTDRMGQKHPSGSTTPVPPTSAGKRFQRMDAPPGNVPDGAVGDPHRQSTGLGTRSAVPGTSSGGTNPGTRRRFDTPSETTTPSKPEATAKVQGPGPDSRGATMDQRKERPGSHGAEGGTLQPDQTAHEGKRISGRRAGSTGDRQPPKGPITRSKKETHLDEFGLQPFYPEREGKNEPFYVTLLAEKWCKDREHLRDRVINGDSPSESTLSEHRRRFEFIYREAVRTKAKLPSRFTLN